MGYHLNFSLVYSRLNLLNCSGWHVFGISCYERIQWKCSGGTLKVSVFSLKARDLHLLTFFSINNPVLCGRHTIQWFISPWRRAMVAQLLLWTRNWRFLSSSIVSFSIFLHHLHLCYQMHIPRFPTCISPFLLIFYLMWLPHPSPTSIAVDILELSVSQGIGLQKV